MSTAGAQRVEQDVAHSTQETRIGWALTIAAVLVYPLLLWRGWGAWNDVLVDYGRELYVPWRINEGEVLYRDLAYFNGPLSPYWNSLVFLVAGVSLRSLTIANAIQTALFGWLLHRRVRSAGGPIAAGAVLLAFELIFACGHYPGIGNYNFLAPYSHELTHGLLLGLLAFSAALGARRTGRTQRYVVTGLLLGLVFLTKAEVFIATLGALLWWFVVRGRASSEETLDPGATSPQRGVCVALASSLVPPILACALLAIAMPFGDALYGTMGSWMGILGSEASELFFYQAYMGLDRAGENLAALFGQFGWLLLILLPAAGFDRWQRQGKFGLRAGVALLYAAAIVAVLSTKDWEPLDWLLVARFLPLLALLALGYSSWRAWVLRGKLADLWAERAGLCVFALLMMLKMILIAMLSHYGFALAVGGAAIFALVWLEWLPQALGTGASRGLVLRAAALALIGVTAANYWTMSEGSFAEKTITVGQGADAFRAAPPRAHFVAQALDEIETRLGPEQSLLALPEGIMMNYLSRRPTPTRHLNFMPPEMELFGEDVILADFEEAEPPAAILIIHKDTSEYGFPFFGVDYGTKLSTWAQQRYRPDWLGGDPPLQPNTRFGIGLLGPK